MKCQAAAAVMKIGAISGVMAQRSGCSAESLPQAKAKA
jgi:hypothetical protein